jgi:two-component system chemotaxis response regulator CheY
MGRDGRIEQPWHGPYRDVHIPFYIRRIGFGPRLRSGGVGHLLFPAFPVLPSLNAMVLVLKGRFKLGGLPQVADFDFTKFKVLVVEDSDFVRRVVCKYLGDLRFDAVFEASNGMEGIAELKKKPDIIICDIEMEPLNGFEFLKLLRKQPGPEKDTPLIFLTSTADASYVNRAVDLGVNAYILKPVMPDQLRRKIIETMTKALSG